MKRIFLMWLIIFSFFTTKGYALGTDTPNDVPSFEQPYFDVGFKSVETALKECEAIHHRELRLPIKLPPIPFTHHLGRCVNDKGEYNDELEIEYLHKARGMNHYKIDIRPIEQKIDFGKSRGELNKFKLRDGSDALYFTTKTPMSRGGFNLLVFEKNGWQYRLAVDARIGGQVAAKALIGIADSVK